MLRRKKGGYFEQVVEAPAPCKVRLEKCVNFSEADVMGIVWHGNYVKYFEEASAVLGRKCGLSYTAYYEAKVQTPIVQMHIDYHHPLVLEDKFTVEASYVWTEGARLYTEFSANRADGVVAATGYTIQMFIDPVTKVPLLTSPPILQELRRRWLAGDFK